MKFYKLAMDRTFEQSAQIIAVGTWSEGELLPCCGRCTSKLIAPLQVMWVPGSDVIDDFAWSPFHVAIVQDRVVKAVNALGRRNVALPVEYVPYDGCAGRRRKRDKLVEVPYEGPRLRWLQVRADVSVNREASGIVAIRHCHTCRHVRHTFSHENLVIPASQWRGQNIFRLRNYRIDTTYVTEEGRAALAEFSNVRFIPSGVIA
jgi:hypothetical protein